MIAQYELQEYMARKEEFDLAQKRLEVYKKDLMERLDKRERVQVGELQACLISQERRTPAWKGEFIRVAGLEAAEKVIETTPASVSLSLKVSAKPHLVG